MELKRILTIEPSATKANIRKDGRSVNSYARLRGFAEGTLARILAGTYPHGVDYESEYQRALRALESDGYLVNASKPKRKAA